LSLKEELKVDKLRKRDLAIKMHKKRVLAE
jgi:hypothetical protein